MNNRKVNENEKHFNMLMFGNSGCYIIQKWISMYNQFIYFYNVDCHKYIGFTCWD